MAFARLMLLAAGALAAVLPPAEDVHPRVLVLPLVPVAVRRSDDGRLARVRLVFVPADRRRECQGRMVSECKTEPWDERLHPRPRTSEPDRVLDVVVGGAGTAEESALLRALAVAPGVRELLERKDSAWTAAGREAEYPIDRRRALRAEVRWTASPRRQTLELLHLR